MRKDLQYISTIQMSVQTSELQIIGLTAREELHLSCSLMNIGRGNCNIRLKKIQDFQPKIVGKLIISVDRPVMNGEILLDKMKFNRIVDLFKNPFPRPATLVVLLDQELLINDAGDLMLEAEKQLNII